MQNNFTKNNKYDITLKYISMKLKALSKLTLQVQAFSVIRVSIQVKLKLDLYLYVCYLQYTSNMS